MISMFIDLLKSAISIKADVKQSSAVLDKDSMLCQRILLLAHCSSASISQIHITHNRARQNKADDD